jgi:hypothetical protein
MRFIIPISLLASTGYFTFIKKGDSTNVSSVYKRKFLYGYKITDFEREELQKKIDSKSATETVTETVAETVTETVVESVTDDKSV